MRPLSSPSRPRHRVPTADGWPITLHEYGDPEDPRPPVLLCHGAFSNHFIYDLGRGFGLAPYLARDGRRVFCVDLRGRGSSVPRGPLRRLHAVLVRGWTIDDLLLRDLPAAIGFVLRHTGAAQLDYVGHSMGGLLIMAHLARTGDPRVRRVVSVGSADFRTMEEARLDPGTRQVDLAKVLAPVFLTLPVVPVGALTSGIARLPFAMARATGQPGWNPSNVDRRVVRRYMHHGLVTASSRKLRVFENLPEPGSLARYRHPTLFVVGAKDGLVAPEVTRRCFERIGSEEKKLLLYSRANGHRADYGHADLLIGRHVEAEIFPDIAAWLT